MSSPSYFGGCCCSPITENQVASVTVVGCFELSLADCIDDAQCLPLRTTYRNISDRLQPGLEQLLALCLSTPFPDAGHATRIEVNNRIFSEFTCPAAASLVLSGLTAYCGYTSINCSDFGPTDIVGYAQKVKHFRSATERYCHNERTERSPVGVVDGIETINRVITFFPAANTVEVVPQMPPLITPCDGPPRPAIGPFIQACRCLQQFVRSVGFESAPGGVCVFP